MLPPPPDITTRLFTQLPDDLNLSHRGSPWITQMSSTLGKDLKLGSFLEGPSFDRQGNLFVVDIAHGRIFCISSKGDWKVVADYDGQPNGLKIHRDGYLIVADQQHGLLKIDPETGKIETLLSSRLIHDYRGVNDLFFTENGDCYFTDQGHKTGLQDWAGRVFCLTADGALVLVMKDIPSPNGLVMNLNETTLYVAVTQMNAVWRSSIQDKKGEKVGIFTYLMAGFGPDGLALDSEGNLAIAHPGNGQVWLFNPQGVPIGRVVSCAGKLPTNIAFGGSDNSQLYITESETGSILIADMPAPGKPMFSHS
tara:strand:+ start:446 stop:1372 length:927 start_codon:yes stop_codon:yes gene_type:complete